MGGAKGCGKDGGCAPLEYAARFPLSHKHDGDGLSTSDAVSRSDVVASRMRKLWAGQQGRFERAVGLRGGMLPEDEFRAWLTVAGGHSPT
jgi:hypothetical protein